MRLWIAYLCLGFAAPATAQTEFATLRDPVVMFTPDQLLRMPEHQLLDLYSAATPSPLPVGFLPGTMIFKPGTHVTVAAAKVMRASAWQGKYITCDRMTNRTFGVATIATPIELGTSYVDGRPSVVLDYAGSRPFFVKRYRDEVREVSPGVYLGIMHRRGEHGVTIATWFALDGRR